MYKQSYLLLMGVVFCEYNQNLHLNFTVLQNIMHSYINYYLFF
jgi:hypothetical protein